MAARAADSLRDFTPLVEIPLKGAAAAAAAVISYMKTGQESKAKNVVNACERTHGVVEQQSVHYFVERVLIESFGMQGVICFDIRSAAVGVGP